VGGLFEFLLFATIVAAGPTSSWELSEPRVLTLEELQSNPSENWCREGSLVMIPDGREGRVTSIEGEICRVLAYGEAYVSVWTYDLVEPVYPQETLNRGQHSFGH
jgi:hypothetical protein